jgi:tRNA(adenine34) deaminase
VQDWGGILGLTLPMDAPERFKGLLVMNTTLATGEQPLSDGFLSWRNWCQSQPLFDVGKLFKRGNPVMTTQETAAYNSPFPDKGYRAALRAFPPMVPEFADSPGAAISRQARNFWRNDWQGQSFMAIGQQDPVLGEPVMRQLQSQIKGCPEPMLLPDSGHFVQEQGRAVAEAAVRHFKP